MIVAVTKNMHKYAEYLTARGFNVVTLGKYNGYVDAILYRDGELYESVQARTANHDYIGVFMLNVSNYSLPQIKKMLESRTYSSLF